MATDNKLKQVKKKIYSFFRHAKPIGSLAIGEKSLVLMFADKKGKILIKEVSLDSLDRKNIFLALQKVKKEIGRLLPSFIVSLPPKKSFIRVFEFPMVADKEQIEGAMGLAVSTLPVPESEIYTDWMPLKNENLKKKETVLGMNKKEEIDYYLKIFEEIGISSIAVETHTWSFGRFLEEGDKITIVMTDYSDSAAFAIYDGQIPYFQFDLPKEIYATDVERIKAIEHFTRRLIHFVSAEDNQMRKVDSVIIFNNDELKENLAKKIPEIKFEAQFFSAKGNSLVNLAAFGAFQRGLIPRREDSIVSLMPTGTELAYEHHRLFSFVDFVQKFLIGFVGLLIVLFSGTLLMVQLVSQNIEKSLQKETSLPVAVVEIKEKADWFNGLLSQISKIYAVTPIWEKIFEEIDKYNGIGITIISVSSDTFGNIQFSGIAANRDSLILLKNKLENSEILEAESFPLSLFLSQENIAFTARAKLKDIAILYPKQ